MDVPSGRMPLRASSSTLGVHGPIAPPDTAPTPCASALLSQSFAARQPQWGATLLVCVTHC